MTHATDRKAERLQLETDLFDRYDTAIEDCIADDRAGLRPAEVVQRNLLRLLPTAPVPVSCLHTHRDTGR